MSLFNNNTLNLSSVSITIHLHYSSSNSTIFICQMKGDLFHNNNQLINKTQNTLSCHQPLKELNQLYQNIERFFTNKKTVHLNCELMIISTPFKASMSYFSSIKICTGLICKIVSFLIDR